MSNNTSNLKSRLSAVSRFEKSGKITQVVGLVIESEGPVAPIGEVCLLKDKNGNEINFKFMIASNIIVFQIRI